MIIKFKKNEDYYFVKNKHIQLQDGSGMKFKFTWTSVGSAGYNNLLSSLDFIALGRILKKKFKSVRFLNEVPNDNRFWFKDKSDEAHFLLWSSEGIEI